MSTISSSSFNQLTFAWPESEIVPIQPLPTPARTIPLGTPVPAAMASSPARVAPSKPEPMAKPTVARRGKPEHISDLLLVVLDRYGISPDEFLAGLE